MNAGIAIAGSGGQGVLLMGRLLAEAGLKEGHEVVWLPFYGAEKRGGVVSCHVIISDDRDGALFVTRPTAAIAMNQASMEKLAPAVAPGGLLVANRGQAAPPGENGIRMVNVPGMEIAAELGDGLAGNMVVLGALAAAEPVVSVASLVAALEIIFRGRNHADINQRALVRGYELVAGGIKKTV
ncbi:MAG: 2-oxoacid:acceptor oxidoreductase family protein [Chloroflexi bacterium]|nr:2-oxoacid:acceptor oxidoreductase family protein [Chloroflexota bacterium]